MSFKSIRAKMLVYILTIILICLAALTAISYFRSSSVISETIKKQMEAEIIPQGENDAIGEITIDDVKSLIEKVLL